MALPSSGQLSINDIYTEIYGLSIPAAGATNVSLQALSFAAGFTAPHAISDFYGYSSWYPSYAGAMGASSRVVFSTLGSSQTININCAYTEGTGSTGPYVGGSTYSTTSTNGTYYATTWQDTNGVTPDSFVLNDDSKNRLYVYRTIPPFTSATFWVYLYPPSLGAFSGMSYVTSNCTVVSQTLSSTFIQLTCVTSGGSLSSQSIYVYFTL